VQAPLWQEISHFCGIFGAFGTDRGQAAAIGLICSGHMRAASSVGVAAAKALACALGADTVPIAQNHMPGRSRQRDGTAHRCRCGASAKAADRQVSRLPNQGRAGLAPGIGIAAPSGIFPALRVYRPPRADGIMAS